MIKKTLWLSNIGHASLVGRTVIHAAVVYVSLFTVIWGITFFSNRCCLAVPSLKQMKGINIRCCSLHFIYLFSKGQQNIVNTTIDQFTAKNMDNKKHFQEKVKIKRDINILTTFTQQTIIYYHKLIMLLLLVLSKYIWLVCNKRVG